MSLLPDPLLSAALEHSREALVVTDARGRARWASPAAIGLLNGRPIDAVHPADRRRVAAAYRELTSHDGESRDLTCRVVAGAGVWEAAEVTVVNRLRDPELGAWVTVVRPRRSPGPDPDHPAERDSLTDLPNRRALARHLGDSGPHTAVLFIDLDGFKEVNDTLGHAAGDRLLVAVADRLRRAVRPEDTVCRLGGDEFVVVAAAVDHETDALEVAERVRVAVARPVPLSGRIVRLTASIGVALAHDRAATVLEDADAAMYQAKRDGGDRAELWRAGMVGVEAARALAADTVHDALEGGGMTLVAQPVVDLGSREVVAASVLLRLRDDAGELVGIRTFLEAAERSGLIESVGAGLLDLAVAEAAAWGPAGPGGGAGEVWVPLSPRQLATGRMASTVDAALERHHLDPARLLLEIDERALADAGTATWRALGELKDLGIGLGVTGFGSGGASLAYLRRARVDLLVLDPAIVAGLGHDSGDTEVARAFVGLGEALGLRTAGVGIERADQAALLRQLGCRLGQGFLFGRPVAPDELRGGGPAA